VSQTDLPVTDTVFFIMNGQVQVMNPGFDCSDSIQAGQKWMAALDTQFSV
jgi:hypothetical protein